MNLEYGDPVIIFAPDFYRTKRLGLFMDMCKDHDGAFRVRLFGDVPIRDVCVNPANGRDSIEIPTPENASNIS